jgi:glutathione synthase
MGLTVAIQMDPIEDVDIEGDSSFALALEAQTRGHALGVYEPRHLSLKDGVAIAKVSPVTVRRERGNHVTKGEAVATDLSSLDVVLLRQDPPFDMSYITTTHILDHIHPGTLVVNDPAHVRNAPEKLFANAFIAEHKGLLPPTLISMDTDEIKAFREEHKDIIIKPLYGNGGAGVFRLQPGDQNMNSLLEIFREISREPVIVQAYLPQVRQGDKRIILVDGVAVGAINRIPAAGEARSNMHVGGRAVASDMTPRDIEICEIIGPELKRRGLVFVGIDVIGAYLTEINVTSPTGIQEVKRFGGNDIAALIWDAIEERVGKS